MRALLEMLSELAPREDKRSISRILDIYLLELGMLEDAYITSRYATREFKRGEAERLMIVVKEVMENVA